MFAHGKLDGAFTSCRDYAHIAAMPMKDPPHVGRVFRHGIFEPLALSISKAVDVLWRSRHNRSLRAANRVGSLRSAHPTFLCWVRETPLI